MNLTREQLTQTEPHHFSAEASELGIAPGAAWPERLETPGTLGNGRPFFPAGWLRHNGTVIGRQYDQDLGCVRVTIYND